MIASPFPPAPSRPPRAPRSRTVRAPGFTLIEVLIVVAIIGILGAIAYPAYGKYVVDARRSDGHLALLQEVQGMERCRSTTFSYASPPCVVTAQEGKSVQGHYSLSIDSDANTYTLKATAIGAQANDEECKEMTIDQRDERLPEDCWK